MYFKKEDYKLSEIYYGELLEIYHKLKKVKNQDLINATIELANIYILQGKRKEIRQLKDKSEKNLNRSLGLGHPTTLYLVSHLSKLI